MSAESTISPKQRERLQQLFVRGNEQMSKRNYEYADDIYFTPCILQDPGKLSYTRTLLANLQKKFGDKKKTTSSLIAVGKKMAVDSKKPENLFKVCIETLKSNPWDIATLVATGDACEALGLHETAIIYYQSAVDADPNHIGANLACCAALREAADFDGAIACVQRILKLRPDDLETRKLLNDISAEKTIHRGKYATGTSRDILEPAKPMVPENEDAMGRILTVEEQFERRIAKNPKDAGSYAEFAQWYDKHSNFAKAEEWYAKAVSVSQDTPDMVERLLETQKKRLHAETLHLKEEYEKNPNEKLKNIFFTTRNQYEEKSIELAQHRIKRDPNYAGYRYDYGMLLQKGGQVKEAIAELQFAKADVARQGDCLLALGQCFQMLRQYKLAMTHYQEAVLALQPGENKKKALYLAMKLAFTLEDYGQAEEYGHQLAAIDFSYRDLGEMLDQISQKH
jgi:tetratricopeptide (TPR) repeat protein